MSPSPPARGSPLRIPLVAQALSDPQVKLRARAIDRSWRYARLVPVSVSGFNPLRAEVYHARISALAEWLRDPRRSARAHNFRDRLIHEVLFVVHDYLHCWAYLAIRDLAPRIGFGTRPITAARVEDFAFCHLLSEAVATVGLDYWYLATVELDDLLEIGTLHGPLTTSYRERRLPELRRFAPGFEVQSREFFSRLARFYCDGVFPGFDPAALRRSPAALAWLEHELQYGEKQREYVREWLAYLSVGRVAFTRAQLKAPVRVDQRWQQALITELGSLLWDKVKRDERHRFGARAALPHDEIWTHDPAGPLDFRFVNLNRVADARLRALGKLSSSSFIFLFYQLVSRYPLARCDPQLHKLLKHARESEDLDLVRWLFRDQRPLSRSAGEPADLFFLN